MDGLGDAAALFLRRSDARRARKTSRAIAGRCARSASPTIRGRHRPRSTCCARASPARRPNAWISAPAIPERQSRSFRLLPPRAPRHAVARCGGVACALARSEPENPFVAAALVLLGAACAKTRLIAACRLPCRSCAWSGDASGRGARNNAARVDEKIRIAHNAPRLRRYFFFFTVQQQLQTHLRQPPHRLFSVQPP